MSGKFSRFTRVAGAAALAATLVIGPLGLANAQAELGSFTSAATGFALRVTVDFEGLFQKLPAAAQAQIETNWDAVRNQAPDAGLPENFPQKIDQYFSKTTVDAGGDITKATSSLAEGSLVNVGVTAEKVGETATKSESFKVPPANDALPVDVTVIDAVTGVLKASVATGPTVSGEATLAEVNATLGNLVSMLPADVQSAFTAVEDAVNTAVTDAETNLDAAVATLAAEVDEASDPLCSDATLGTVLVDSGLCGATADATQALTDLLNLPALPDISGALVAGDIANVSELVNTTTAQKTDGGVSSADAASTIKAVDVLGGLLSASLINLSSHSEATGVADSAKTSGSCSIGSVNVGDSAQITIDGDGIQVSGVEVPAGLPVDPATVISTLQDEVGNILQTAGVGDVGLCETATDAKAADGTSASHSVSAFNVVIEPTIPAAVTGTPLEGALASLGLAPGDSLVKVTIDPTVGTGVAAAQAAPAASLPRTGAPAVATILSGIMLAGGALALRRKMR